MGRMGEREESSIYIAGLSATGPNRIGQRTGITLFLSD